MLPTFAVFFICGKVKQSFLSTKKIFPAYLPAQIIDFKYIKRRCEPLEFGLNKIFLGLNRIDFLGFIGLKYNPSCES
jgi:hypothetical protein